MKALSILQPWAALIVAGVKDIENRSWPTKQRGEILVHAGKGFDIEAFMWLRNNFIRMGLSSADACKVGDLLDRMNPKTMERGGIIGKVELVDCVKDHASPWKAEGTFGFVLRNATALPFRPLRGQLGFFEVADDLIHQPMLSHKESEC